MLRQERSDDLSEALLIALQGFQSGLWTSIPGIIHAVQLQKQTCTVQPALQARIRKPSGEFEWVTMPLLVDVPIYYPCGGGFTLTFPVAPGDECLVVFASRCIDAWWQSGGIQVQAELRMHDLSDGFAFVGVRSQPRKLPNVSEANVQLRNDVGDTFVEITPGKLIRAHSPVRILAEAPTIDIIAETVVNVQAPTINVEAATTINMEAPTINITGNLNFQGLGGSGIFALEGDLNHTAGSITSLGKKIDGTHTHGGVVAGGDNTAEPNP